MADAYARVTGQPGVCVLISGPGVTNAATPIAEAYHDSIPMLVVAAAGRRADLGRGNGSLHDLPDQAGLLRSITALSRTVLDATELPDLLADAWRIFDTRRPRPVHIALPTDLLAEESPPRAGGPRQRRECGPAAAIRRAAELLAGATRPAIILSGGSVDAGAGHRSSPSSSTPRSGHGNARGVIPSIRLPNSTLPLEPIRSCSKPLTSSSCRHRAVTMTRLHGVPLRSRMIIRVDLD
jgi:acetolactate synthase-1/2/3 large subunit